MSNSAFNKSWKNASYKKKKTNPGFHISNFFFNFTLVTNLILVLTTTHSLTHSLTRSFPELVAVMYNGLTQTYIGEKGIAAVSFLLG